MCPAESRITVFLGCVCVYVVAVMVVGGGGCFFPVGRNAANIFYRRRVCIELSQLMKDGDQAL